MEELLQVAAEFKQLRRKNAELQQSIDAIQAREGALLSNLQKAEEESRELKTGARKAHSSYHKRNRSSGYLYLSLEMLACLTQVGDVQVCYLIIFSYLFCYILTFKEM